MCPHLGIVGLTRKCYFRCNLSGGASMCPGRRQVFLPLSCAVLLFGAFAFSAQDKPSPSKDLKIGFLMDSLKVERWQTDLDNFQKRAGELGAQVLAETAEGGDQHQPQVHPRPKKTGRAHA